MAREALSATAGAARADATALRVEMSLPTGAASPKKESSVPVPLVFETALSDGHTLVSHATKESSQAVDASYSSA